MFKSGKNNCFGRSLWKNKVFFLKIRFLNSPPHLAVSDINSGVDVTSIGKCYYGKCNGPVKLCKENQIVS